MKRSRILMFFIVGLLSLALVGISVASNEFPQQGNPSGVTGSRSGPSDTTLPVEYVSPASFSEGFDDITNLPGWYMQNNSNPIGIIDWFQGNNAVFPAHAGSPTAYIAANYNNTAGTGTISNWLLTPEQLLGDGATFSFWTRTVTDSAYPDRLQVRLSTAGSSTDVGTGAGDVGVFTTLLLDINPTLAVGGYPDVWTQYTVTLSSIPAGSTGRLAFRYYVTDGGPSGSNSNYIGIDTVEYTDPPLALSITLSKTVGTDPLTCAVTDEITVPAETDVTYCYEVNNTGDIELDYHDLVDTELGVILDNLPYALAPGASAFVTQTVTINATTVNTATWRAYNETSYVTIPYDFEDISGTGTPFSLDDDEVSGALPLGFSFNYFGMDYTDVYASSNGFLTVLPGQSSGCCTGQPLPTPGDPDGVIAGWWEDLNPGEAGTGLYYKTLGTAPDRRFIVQYTNVQHFPNGNPVTLQYKLFEGSNLIEVHYMAAPSDGGTHSAGIENHFGTNGTQYYIGPVALTTPMALRYIPPVPAIATDTALVNMVYPEIDTSPDSLTSSQSPDSAISKILTISNLGHPLSELKWQVYESLSADKLSASLQIYTGLYNPPAEIGPMSVRSPAGQETINGIMTIQPQSWNTGSPIPNPIVRYAFAQCPQTPDSFYVISGVTTGGTLTADTWRYDAGTNTWTELAPIPTPREGPSATCYGNYIYVMGGGGTNQFYIYDIASDFWVPAPPLPRNVWGAATGAYEGKIFMIAGDTDFFMGGASNSVDIFDIISGTWSSGSPIPAALVTPGYTQAGRYIFVVGGWGDASPGVNQNTTFRYNIETDTWDVGPVFSSARADFGLGITQNYLYALGGDANGGSYFESSDIVETLDYTDWAGSSWVDIADPLQTKVTANNGGFCTNARSGGEVWTAGGIDISFVFRDDNVYRPSESCTVSWEDIPWLSEIPITGTVAGGESASLEVVFNSTGLDFGTYTGTLIILSNDPNKTISEVPITLEVVYYKSYMPIVRK